MKKILYLLLLFTGITNAQIVNIPDANFKAKLIQLGVDANADGEIQVSEALIPTNIDVSSSNISDLTGISAFTNLTNLYCNDNTITSINASSLTHLVGLACYNNQLTNLNVTGLNQLYNLYCSNNLLTSLDVSGLTNLYYLYCFQNQLTTLNVTGLPLLDTIHCYSNQLTSLTLSNLPNLRFLNCEYNSLSSVDVSQLVSLQGLYCNSNQISTLDISSINNLYDINISHNQVTSINVLGQSHLRSLYCSNNQITTLDLSNLAEFLVLDCSNNQISSLTITEPSIVNLKCNNNQLTSLDLSSFPNLTNIVNCGFNPLTELNVNGLSSVTNLYCGNTLLTELDLHTMTALTALDCSNMTNLVYINWKNGGYYNIGSYLLFINNPSLQYVCADEENINFFINFFDFQLPGNTIQITPYCTFVPSGNYNTISGNLKFDIDNNGCDINDLNTSKIRVNINDGTNQGANFTNTSGNYTFYTQAGTFAISPAIENPTWFNFSPTTATIPFANNNNNTATQNFCLTANGVHPDVEMVIVPITPARPGFDAVYKLVYRNKGNQTSEVFLNFTYNEDLLDFVSSSLTPNNNVNGHMSWIIQDLQPFQSGSVLVTLNVNAPTETPAVNIDDVLVFTSFIDISTDENWVDNAFTLNQTVVGSFDPNDITCLEGDIVSPAEIGNYLHYNVRFENTGTAPAENIVVKVDVNSADFDINSLQLMNTSHPVEARIRGSIVEFIFQNIMLDSGGHGNVLLKMRSQPNLQQGDLVNKRANIYFDYNFPIETNDAETVFQALNNSNFEQDSSIKIYPNPTSSIVNVNGNFNIKSIEFYDVQGRLLLTEIVNSSLATLDISSRAKGIYLVKVISEKGIKVEKLIKE
jgi:Leucine-rich repeat (LRR) protein